MSHKTNLVHHVLSKLDASVLGWAAASLLLFVICRALYLVFLHPLSKVPGPRLAKITELWRTNRYIRGYWHRDILDLHRKYGPVVRISPNEVSIVSPEVSKTVYSYSGGTQKTDWYDVWRALGGTEGRNSTAFFGATDPNQHAFLRRRVSTTYTLSTILAAEPKVQGVLDSLWERFDEFAKAKQPINLTEWSSYFTYDVVGTLCISEPLGFIRDRRDKTGFIAGVHNAFFWCANLGYLPWQAAWVVNPVVDFLAPRLGLEIANYRRGFLRFTVEKVLQRMNDKTKEPRQRDMLDHFLEMKGPQGQPVTLPELLADVGNLFAAGADTTSVAVRVVLLPLLSDPARYERLRSEIDSARAAAGIMGDSEKALSYHDIKGLPFLGACIKEGSRVHPSIIWQLPRKAPAEGVNIEGYYIGSSATISMSPLAQNRCRAIFGEDADEWRPERWIAGEGNSAERIKEMDKNLATFGYGSRTCVGRNLATFEAYKFIAQLLSRYDVELEDPKKPLEVRSLWFAEVYDMNIKLEPRR
ncbi:cytochrome P450 [Diaporthe sp. PMI_573]|nr:cytochrome P450 [Diaporthaceae sp. PMI_573]